MANHYYSWTVPLRETDVPADMAPDGNALPDVISEAMARPDTVLTNSRNDWLHFMLLRVFSALGGSALAFLVKDPESLTNIDPAAFRPVLPGSRVHWQEIWVITMLPCADLTHAIEEVNAWLETTAAEPVRIANLLDDGCDAEDISRYLSEAVDLREEGAFQDDGDLAPYLFCFLKALRAMLLDARAKDLAIVHVRYVYLFREVAPA